jgi:hypothetical protein
MASVRRLTTAFGGVATLAIGGAMLLEDASAAIVPVISIVGGTPPWRSPITSGSS